jgi:hypothetical protein
MYVTSEKQSWYQIGIVNTNLIGCKDYTFHNFATLSFQAYPPSIFYFR